MATFQTSTHKNWIFSQEKLSSLRREHLGKLQENEDRLLKRHFEVSLLNYGESRGFPEKVQATAVIYFKRFFLYHSLLEYDPATLMNTCLFLASKAEEYHISIGEMTRRVGGGPDCGPKGERILETEVTLLEGLRFNLLVYHPYRPALGFVSQLKLDYPTLDEAAILERARINTRALLCTDVILLRTPAQVALGVLWVEAAGFRIDMESYIRKRFGQSADALLAIVKNIAKLCEGAKANMNEFVLHHHTPPNSPLRALLARYATLRNPTTDPTTQAYQDARRAREEEHETKRRIKEAIRAREQAESEDELLRGPLRPQPQPPQQEDETTATTAMPVENPDDEQPGDAEVEFGDVEFDGFEEAGTADDFLGPSATAQPPPTIQ
ncbi:putative cyclin H [Paratrimastix pyriformis]|uniref:Cyclin H n=1 Tax=Paratrimastix pyriformis TaxID=342808 RepID=A0ABQ8UGF0_9EUKA|nr:putative cyclin H [Paratrimastix pyriformis]